ncbi:MAG: hypothetical protein H7249_12135 [Chitinophagaceae bacterium]|nr:hypothetical protein [Oligoflexus sp.]
MDSPLAKVKVQPGTIKTRIEEIDTTIEVQFSKPVDEQMLSLFMTLKDTPKQAATDARDECFARVSQSLRKAQSCLVSRDMLTLDELAQDLSHTALKIGAAQLLSSAIEIQGLARIGDFKTAAELLGRMEVELFEVKAHYA